MFTKSFSFFVFLFLFTIAVQGDFNSDGMIVGSRDHATITENGSLLQLTLDEATSGIGYDFNNKYAYGKFQTRMKLVPGYSDGTVATFYVFTSGGDPAQEIDLEFIGNVTEKFYRLSTNIITPGAVNREQAFNLWFNPTQDFHTYTIFWNQHQILFSVDGTPIRIFENASEEGVSYPKNLPMTLKMTIWHAEWAETHHPINWSRGPFTVSYRGYGIDSCLWEIGVLRCPPSITSWWDKVVKPGEMEKIKYIKEKHMVYDYCDDRNHKDPKHSKQYPECSLEL